MVFRITDPPGHTHSAKEIANWDGESIQGDQGEPGPVGPRGEKGDSVLGPVGPVGPEGPEGPVGPAGLQGIRGMLGPQGQVGSSLRPQLVGAVLAGQPSDKDQLVVFSGVDELMFMSGVAESPMPHDTHGVVSFVASLVYEGITAGVSVSTSSANLILLYADIPDGLHKISYIGVAW